MSTLDPGRLPALPPGPSWRPLCVLPCPSLQSLVAALTVPASAGQGAAHAVRVGALSRPGRAQPLRGLAAPGHLSIQHGAGPLSVVATSRGFWAGSARGGHTGLVSACHNQTSGEDGTVGSLPGPLQNQLDGAGRVDGGGRLPIPGAPALLPRPSASSRVNVVHSPDGAERPPLWPRDHPGGRTAGLGPAAQSSIRAASARPFWLRFLTVPLLSCIYA